MTASTPLIRFIRLAGAISARPSSLLCPSTALAVEGGDVWPSVADGRGEALGRAVLQADHADDEAELVGKAVYVGLGGGESPGQRGRVGGDDEEAEAVGRNALAAVERVGVRLGEVARGLHTELRTGRASAPSAPPYLSPSMVPKRMTTREMLRGSGPEERDADVAVLTSEHQVEEPILIDVADGEFRRVVGASKSPEPSSSSRKRLNCGAPFSRRTTSGLLSSSMSPESMLMGGVESTVAVAVKAPLLSPKKRRMSEEFCAIAAKSRWVSWLKSATTTLRVKTCVS